MCRKFPISPGRKVNQLFNNQLLFQIPHSAEDTCLNVSVIYEDHAMDKVRQPGSLHTTSFFFFSIKMTNAMYGLFYVEVNLRK